MENNQNQLEKRQSTASLTIKNIIRQGVKIRELKNDNPIKEALAYVFVLVGLATDKQPKGIEKQVLIDFAIGAYGSFVAEEIKIAFKLALQGEFKDLDTNCYQNFNCEYLGRVMACYFVWRQSKLANKSEGDYKEPKLSDEQYYDRKLITPFENSLKGTDFPFTDFDWIMYDNLYKLGVPIQPSDEERNAFKSEARRITPKKKREKMTEPEELKIDHEKRIMKVAKCMAFKSWIQEQQFNETHLRHMIGILLAK